MSRSSRIQASGGADRGYVLVSVLAAMVLLMLVAGTLDSRVSDWRGQHLAWRERDRAWTRLLEARDTVTWVLLTQPLGRTGFGAAGQTLRVDGRWYRLPSGMLLSVQDERGLLSMATPDPQRLRSWLRLQGLDEATVEQLVDSLADYIDLDDLRRLNGAEAQAYRLEGLGAPRNDWPISPYELRQVHGWHRHPKLWLDAHDHFTAVRDGWINVNTAPASVLHALAGASDAGVQALIKRREVAPFRQADEVLAATGLNVPDDPVAFHPGTFFRVRLLAPGGQGGMEYTHLLTPDAPAQPWLTLEVRPFVASMPDPDSVEALPLPWPSTERVPPAADPQDPPPAPS